MTFDLNEFSEEKHAELCYTECLLFDALLTFIQVSVGFVEHFLTLTRVLNKYYFC